MNISFKRLTGAIAIVLMVLPASAQDEPDTAKVEKDVQVTVDGEGRYIIMLNGVLVDSGRTQLPELDVPRLKLESLDSLLADSGVSLDHDVNEIVITGEGGELIRRRAFVIDDDRRVGVRGNRMRRARPSVRIKGRGAEGRRTVERRIEIDGDSAVVRIERHGPTVQFSRIRPEGEREMEYQVEIESDGAVARRRALSSRMMELHRHSDGRRGRQDMRGARPDRGNWRASRDWQGGQWEKVRQMEAEARRLARAVRGASDEDRAEHEEALRNHLVELFDLKMRQKADMIEKAQERLGERAGTLEERRENRDAIIEDRLSQLLGRGSAYRW